MADPKPGSNPLDVARKLTAPPRPKRFYTTAEAREEEGGFALRLDGKRAMTPGKQPLVVPRRELADAIVNEWLAQGDLIDPATMPVTRLANSAIDGVAPRIAEVRQPIRGYAASDLLYYRAGEPAELVTKQREAWDPILAWAEQRFGARFMLSEGVMHVAQPERTLIAIAAGIDAFDEPFRLAGLSLAASLSGSALIALALADGFLDVADAWSVAHVDEDWNIEKWGEDAEAKRRRDLRFRDFQAAAMALGALG
jgi:chaperone required for assembly of F1-ATPase